MKPLLSYDQVHAPKKPKPHRERFADRAVPELREFTRRLDCLLLNARHRVSGDVHRCQTPVECAHVRARGAAGPDFDNTVPLCAELHRLGQYALHRIGRRSFEYRHQVRLAPAAKRVTAAFLKAYPELRKRKPEGGTP